MNASMQPRRFAALVSILALSAGACGRSGGDQGAASGRTGAASATAAPRVLPGIDVLLSDSLGLVRGRRVGLITNHTGRTADGRHDIDVLADNPDIRLVALFAPEHGIRGEEQAGAVIAGGVDERTGVPVHSLYGDTIQPTPEMLDSLDVLLFDIQDVGARYYTYPSTMALAMQAAGQAGIPFVVLDRPDPIRGDVVQGNVLDIAYSSFVGRYPVPMRHGMTMGELARMMVGAFGVQVELHVVPVTGWSRDMTYDQTGLTWLPPSPNIPTLGSALAYPGTCLFEGTPLSVGRGTDHAFDRVGAPWIDGQALADTLNGYGFAGVRFEPATFTPHGAGDQKFNDVEVHGVRVVGSTTDYDAPRVGVAMLVEARRLSGDRWQWSVSHFDRLAGTDALRVGLDAGEGLAELTAGWDAQVADFEGQRAPYLLYR
jgi:uncharacterized protein YbbC (DUF1343 family)